MITADNTWDDEKAYLDRVEKEIKTQIDIGTNAADNFKRDALELQREMWEEVRCAPTGLSDLEDVTQIWQYQKDISHQARKYKFSSDKVSRLERMYPSPYFGRIDFIEEGEEKAEPIYIGVYNLSTRKNMEILVYDWRAPISGMFYDFEIGMCSYDCPAGSIKGKLLLKRQYKIENSNIVYMFDSSLSINDEMLKEILGKSTDSRMKTIVASIQKEQNTVIRNSLDKILIVEGPAGSGKTSIALHRAAFLLYKYRDNIKSENIIIFSPNHVFEDYISSVLPELGEINIQRSTFTDFFGKMLKSEYRIETMNQHMEYILSEYADITRLSSIRLKASQQFLKILFEYVNCLENGMTMVYRSIVYNGVLVISDDEIHQLFINDYNCLPYAKCLEKLRQRLFYLLDNCEEKRSEEMSQNAMLNDEEKILAERKAKVEYDVIKNDIVSMTSFDVYQLYKYFFDNIELFVQKNKRQEMDELRKIAVYTLNQLEQGTINYEDVAPIIFLKVVLEPVKDIKTVKHVIIDEAQDYTAVQYEIFNRVFEHCNMTILGDTNQSVNGYMNIGNFVTIKDIFNAKGTKSISLTKSYRSSKEISDFCKGIIMNKLNTEQLNRHGFKPRVIKTNESTLFRQLIEDIRELKNKNCKLIAVICKTSAQCEALYESICPFLDIGFVSNRNEAYQGDVIVIPSYLAKGLEFDAVLVNSVEERDYCGEGDRKLLYTVCTRALHELYLYYFENLSDLISGIDPNLYIN